MPKRDKESHTHIKICGVKTLEDALAAVIAGADMLGFNFYAPSPRAITPETCAYMLRELHARGHHPVSIGVFVNESPAAVRAILETCGLDLAQLSGDEPPADLRALGPRAFKAVRPATWDEAEQALQAYGREQPPALLIDARAPQLYGGSGLVADWELARQLAQRAPILLAGGLTPANVADAIRGVHPWGVDVASGVESAPGVKDAARMIAFVRAVREASEQ